MEDNIEKLKNRTYSFSSINSFNTCKMAWRLNYLDRIQDRQENAFSKFGSFCHKILEMYFGYELDFWDLAKYYEDHYAENVTETFPPYPKGMATNYYNNGLLFFTNFDFDRNKYNIISIEDTIESEYKGIKLVVKPDLILQDKETLKYILIDYKTSKLKDGKIKEEYRRQFLLYAFFLYEKKDIEVDIIKIWYIRDNIVLDLVIDTFEVQETLDWFENTYKAIEEETEWKGNKTKSNAYFCDQICQYRGSVCEDNLKKYGMIT